MVKLNVQTDAEVVEKDELELMLLPSKKAEHMCRQRDGSGGVPEVTFVVRTDM